MTSTALGVLELFSAAGFLVLSLAQPKGLVRRLLIALVLLALAIHNLF